MWRSSFYCHPKIYKQMASVHGLEYSHAKDVGFKIFVCKNAVNYQEKNEGN